jgi:hypothetical protein
VGSVEIERRTWVVRDHARRDCVVRSRLRDHVARRNGEGNKATVVCLSFIKWFERGTVLGMSGVGGEERRMVLGEFTLEDGLRVVWSRLLCTSCVELTFVVVT